MPSNSVNPLWNMEAANLFAGMPNPDQWSNHLILSNLKLPSFDAASEEHHPGGAPVAVEIKMSYNKLTCTFVLQGLTPQVLGLVNAWQKDQTWFTVFMVLRDQIDGGLWQAVARMQGVLGVADIGAWSKGDTLHQQFAIHGMSHYELRVAGQEVYYWDFGENIFRTGNVSLAPTQGSGQA